MKLWWGFFQSVGTSWYQYNGRQVEEVHFILGAETNEVCSGHSLLLNRILEFALGLRKESLRGNLCPYCRKLYWHEKPRIILSLHPETFVDILAPWTQTVTELEDKNWGLMVDSVHSRYVLKYQWLTDFIYWCLAWRHFPSDLSLNDLNIPLLKFRNEVKKVWKRQLENSLANGEDRSKSRFLDECL